MSDHSHRPHPIHGLVAVLVTAVAFAALAGGLASPVEASPSAAQIDAFLVQHGSPMTGTGATFVAEGQMNGVDPAFLVAIAGAETGFGSLLYAEAGDQATYNAFNWFYGMSWPASDFSSWDEAVTRVAEGLAGPLYYGAGLVSVDAIAPKYCPVGTDPWRANVKAFLSELGGDPDDTRLPGAVPSPAPTAASTGPGLVALQGSVKLDRGDREVGQRIYAWFTLANTGGQPVDLQGIRLAIRGPGAAVRDQVSNEPLTLAPGQAIEVSSSWMLDLAGRWRGWIDVTQGGTASRVGAEQAFGFRVRLPEHLQVQRWKQQASKLSSSL